MPAVLAFGRQEQENQVVLSHMVSSRLTRVQKKFPYADWPVVVSECYSDVAVSPELSCVSDAQKLLGIASALRQPMHLEAWESLNFSTTELLFISEYRLDLM